MSSPPREAEARADREEAPEPLRVRDRVALWEQRGALEIVNLGTVIKRSPTGYIHVEWDDHSEGWFSPGKAAAQLRRAEGEDALPRHIWVSELPELPNMLEAERKWLGPRPTLDEPVCFACGEPQTDDNEFGPCQKAKP